MSIVTEREPTPVDETSETRCNPDASVADALREEGESDAIIELDAVSLDPASLDEAVKQQLHEAEQKVLRYQAELENFRRRTRRELEESLKYANQSLIADLLPVLDNVQRACESADASDSGTGLREGVTMVAQQLEEVLTRHHCPRIDAEGTEFDPLLHEAIAQQPSDDVPAGSVMLVAQRGYRLHERVVRPAQVIVSSGPAEST